MDGNSLFVGNSLPVDTETELLAVNGVDEDSLCPSKPTDQEYEAYTGNAGPTLEYWYKVTLLVIWPKDASLNVMLKADFAAGIRTAQSLVDAELSYKNNNTNNNSSNISTRGSGRGLLLQHRNTASSCQHSSSRLGRTAGALCAQRALKALTIVGGVTTEACAAAVATTVGSLGWAAVGDAVLAVVRSTQLANLDSAAALALNLCSLSPDKRCSGTAAAAATTANAATAAQQHVQLELAAVKQEQVAVGDAAAAASACYYTELTATAAAPVDTVHTATAAVATVQDGAELVGLYVAALGLGLPIVDTTATAISTTAADDDDDIAVVGVAARHSLRSLTPSQAQAVVSMLLALATPSDSAAAAPVRCEEELALLLARAGELTAAALLASLETVLSSSIGSSVSSLKAAVIGALAQGLVAADWQSMPAQSVAAAVKALLQLHQQMPSQLFAATAATSTAIAAAAAVTGVQPQEEAAVVSKIGTTDLLRSALAAVRRMPSKSQQPALTAVLQLPALSQQGAAAALKVNFAKLRLHYLVQHCKPVPAITWHQPAAGCRGHAQLEQFFKGPQQVLRYDGALGHSTGIAAARRAARSLMSGFTGCSANVTAAGTGRNAHLWSLRPQQLALHW
eukprot:4302-Heterococcus_DN1.PRE.2